MPRIQSAAVRFRRAIADDCVANVVLKGIVTMPKMKTRKTAAKRFKITGTGKIMRQNTGRNHLMMKKSGSRKRRLALESTVARGEKQKVRRMIPS